MGARIQDKSISVYVTNDEAHREPTGRANGHWS
jgi:hypothetical protein